LRYNAFKSIQNIDTNSKTALKLASNQARKFISKHTSKINPNETRKHTSKNSTNEKSPNCGPANLLSFRTEEFTNLHTTNVIN